MSKIETDRTELITIPEYYFNAQSKTLGSRLEAIKISEEEERDISKNHTKKFVRDKLLGLFKVGEIISEIIKWNESVDEDIKEAKKEYLLSQYFEKNDTNELALKNLQEFLSNPQGNTLFNKILRILDDTPPDRELSEHLANALRYIINNSFHELFEEHKYALSQIEKITPQCLTILSDSNSWPTIKPRSISASGSKVTSEWLTEFTEAYALIKKIDNPKIARRISHSISELENTGLIEAHFLRGIGIQCTLTEVGRTILPYIKN